MNKQELYNQAKDAYYNGEQIMTDLEFDELEIELGLENESYIGSKSKNYTIPHSFIMGSISKIQVHFNKNGEIEFDKYVPEIEKYLKKSKCWNRDIYQFETTPKMDGCSFEVCIDRHGYLISVSTRGDGHFGKDIKNWFLPEWDKNYQPRLKNWLDKIDEDSFYFLNHLVIRGEVLVKKDIFEKKYSQDFTIPRSFVAGVINQDWEGTPKQIEMRNDLSFITYDYREVYENGTIVEIDYDNSFPGEIIQERHVLSKDRLKDFKNIYLGYEDYRNNTCPFTLDGIVIKPCVNFRLQDNTRERQEDCVAIKFTPEIVETSIEKIEWKVGKSGEYYPTAIVKEIILGGKKVNRVSLHNYDYIVRNQCGVGAIIQVSLAGDIIPQCIKVTKPCKHNLITTPIDSHVDIDGKSGCKHLMKNMSDDEIQLNKYLTSVKVLNIDGIGEKVAYMLYDNIIKVSNIIELMTDDNLKLIYSVLGNTKSSKNIITALKTKRKYLTLNKVIESCGFENCGVKNSLWLAKKLSNIEVSNSGIPSTIIELYESGVIKEVITPYINMFNIQYLKDETNDKIPVIMTGDPSNTQYGTKKLWLQAHPQYRETSSWKEVKILFTNDLESESGKMTKARKKGIEIRLYDE